MQERALTMTRDKIQSAISTIFARQFEIKDPDPDVNLRDAYEFDSIDAIDLLREIEVLLGSELTRDEKESAMEIRTFAQIVDYVEALASKRNR